MRRVNRLGVAVILVALIGGCTLPAPRDNYPDGCSGVPGDDTLPPSALPADLATHGPGAPGQVVELLARARPGWGSPIPLLYVFDASGRHETQFRNPHTLAVDRAFRVAEDDAYWYESIDDGVYQVPEFGQCDIAAILGTTPSFRAPAGGLLFFQFVVPGACDQCDAITRAIEELLAAHPDLPMRWVRVMVPPSVGKLRIDEDA